MNHKFSHKLRIPDISSATMDFKDDYPKLNIRKPEKLYTSIRMHENSQIMIFGFYTIHDGAPEN